MALSPLLDKSCGERRVYLLLVNALLFIVCPLAPLSTHQLFSAAGYTAESHLDIFAIVNESASLPCNITPTGPGVNSEDEAELVLWYRGNSKTPVYSYDERNKDEEDKNVFASGNHFSEDPMRMRFNRVGRVGYLTIRPVAVSDQGIYRCRVDYKEARTTNFYVNLSVIIPPSKPVLKERSGRILNGVLGPLKEGQTLYLACEVDPGHPRATLTWTKNGAAHPTKVKTLSNGKLRTEISVVNLRREDYLTSLCCEARNNDFQRGLRTEVILDMYLPPSEVKIAGLEDPLVLISSSTEREIVCEVAGARPPPDIHWYLDGAKLSSNSSTMQVEENVTVSVLAWIFKKENNGRTLACEATSRLYPGLVKEATSVLHISYPPEAAIRVGQESTEKKVGDEVSFDCKVSGNPEPDQVYWLKDGHRVDSNRSFEVIVTNRTLVILGLAREDGGDYQCVAENPLGSGISQPIRINVLHAPECQLSHLVHHVALGEKIQVSCPVEANPPPEEFRWQLNYSLSGGGFVDFPPTQFSQRGGVSMLTYTPQNPADFGTLQCWSKNKIGQQVEPCIFTLIHTEKPAPPKECSADDESGSSGASNVLVVSCVVGDNGGRGTPAAFTLQVYRDAANPAALLVNQTKPEPRFFITGLHPGTNYQMVVYASNEKGQSQPTLILHPQPSGPPRRQGLLSGISDKIVTASWITGGFGTFFVVVAIMYMGCNKRHTSRVVVSKPNDPGISTLGRNSIDDGNAHGKRQASNCQAHDTSKENYQLFHGGASYLDHTSSPDLILQVNDHMFTPSTTHTSIDTKLAPSTSTNQETTPGLLMGQQFAAEDFTQVPLLTSFAGYTHYQPQIDAYFDGSTFETTAVTAYTQPTSTMGLRNGCPKSATLGHSYRNQHHPRQQQQVGFGHRTSFSFKSLSFPPLNQAKRVNFPFATIRKADSVWKSRNFTWDSSGGQNLVDNEPFGTTSIPLGFDGRVAADVLVDDDSMQKESSV